MQSQEHTTAKLVDAPAKSNTAAISTKLVPTEEADLVDGLVAPDPTPINPVEEGPGEDVSQASLSCWKRTRSRISSSFTRLHQRTPYLNRVPAFVIFPIATLIVVNCAAWVITAIILRYHPYPSCPT